MSTLDQGYIEGQTLFVTAVELGGFHAMLSVPMLKDGKLIGAINIYREETGPFSDKQIDLVQNFAAQAVIAIENTRLLNELRQSLEQQTATAEVLRVISSSPGELKPVFNAMLENAITICDAKIGLLFRFDGSLFETAADVGTPAEYAEFLNRQGQFRPLPGSPLDHMARTKHIAHTLDIAAEAVPGPAAELGRARTHIAVPMLKDDALVGAIIIYRQEVRPFTEKQIELVTNFAAQAVIAIENTRLLNECCGARGIERCSSRPPPPTCCKSSAARPSTCRLCSIRWSNPPPGFAAPTRRPSIVPRRCLPAVACYGFRPNTRRYMDAHPIPAGRASIVGRTVIEGRNDSVHDVMADPEY